MADTSKHKQVSHLRLLTERHANKNYLDSTLFTQDQLVVMCEAYSIKAKKFERKAVICNRLAMGILATGGASWEHASFQCLRCKIFYGFKLRIELLENVLLQHMYTAVQYTGGASIVEWNKTLYEFCK